MIFVEDVTKIRHTRRGPHRVLDRVSFTVERGQGIGILGRNGAGKSTLLRLIGGVEFPDEGRIRREMSVSWPLAFGAGFQGSLSGADNARFIARIYGAPIQRTLEFVNDFAELGHYFYMPIKTYSSGMVGRLAFGISLAIEFDCMLIDEITAAGDFSFTKKCHAALRDRRSRCALVMVSHFPEHLKLFCNMGGVLSASKLTIYDTLVDAQVAYATA